MMKRKEHESKGLIDTIFSWSINDVLNCNLYKHQVNKIPETFLSAEQYLNSFIPSLIEDTHSDLSSGTKSLSKAPIWEIVKLEMSKNFRAPKDLFYQIEVKRAKDAAKQDAGKYEPEAGDLIAFTDIRPKCIEDLNGPRSFYHIAYVQGARDESNDMIPIMSSKYMEPEMSLNKKQQQLFAVYLMNVTTNASYLESIEIRAGGRKHESHRESAES
ncbi:p-loop nucleoside triphosphate hydrolase superfamily protein [Quillaja saponaria]|uniref:P-loop nucleoside triphosphate hydrolase superfamily protein n=1 Tax=Quillaja saponaria TaxID=32244 RepID=A0AAD7LU93_QUISA|nr:p-loop nucleoside triphosphate hydrolase superfamily protein [Quillaja saponaria]